MEQADIDLFAGAFPFFTGDEARSLAAVCAVCNLVQGETLFSVGEPSDLVYFVVQGKCAVKKETGFENKMQVVALLSSGAIIGENVLVAGRKHTTSVVAAEDSRLWTLKAQDLQNLKTSDSRLAMKLVEKFLEVSGKRLAACTQRLARIL